MQKHNGRLSLSKVDDFGTVQQQWFYRTLFQRNCQSFAKGKETVMPPFFQPKYEGIPQKLARKNPKLTISGSHWYGYNIST